MRSYHGVYRLSPVKNCHLNWKYASIKVIRANQLTRYQKDSKAVRSLPASAIFLVLRYAMVSLMMEALSRCATAAGGSGSSAASSLKISDSLPRRHLAASRLFSLRRSLFLRRERTVRG